MSSNKPILLGICLVSKIFSISKKEAKYKLKNHNHRNLALLQGCNNCQLITHIQQKLHAGARKLVQTGCKIGPISTAGKRSKRKKKKKSEKSQFKDARAAMSGLGAELHKKEKKEENKMDTIVIWKKLF